MADNNPYINVHDSEGKLGSIPLSQKEAALRQGYTEATDDQVNQHFAEAAAPGLLNQAAALGQGLGEGFAGPLFTGAEKLLGVNPNTVNTLKQAYPKTFATGNIGGLLTPYGELSLIGKGVGTLIKVAPEARAIAKIGSAAAKGAAEMGVLSSGDEVSKAIMNNPSSAKQALADIGLSTALGGLGGAFFGSAGELWKAKVGPQVSRSLDAISKRVGNEIGSNLTQPKLPQNFSVMTAENPNAQRLTQADNIKRNFALEKDLISNGISFKKVPGYYGSNNENSFLIPHSKDFGPEEAEKLAKQYGQESVIHKVGDKNTLQMINGPEAGKYYEGTGHIFDQNSNQNYSVLDGNKFSLNLDFANPKSDLIHYSQNKQELNNIDPNFFKTGMAGAEKKRGDILPRSYYYEDNTNPEPIVSDSAHYQYRVQKPSNILDLASPEARPIIEKVTSKGPVNPGAIDFNELEKQIKNSGYSGYKNSNHPQLPNAVAIFDKLPVKSLKKLKNYAYGGGVNLNQPAPAAQEDAASGAIAVPDAPAVQNNDPYVNVYDSEGKLGSIPLSQKEAALRQGYTEATDDEVNQHFAEAAAPGLLNQAAALGQGLGEGFAGPLFTGAEKSLGVDPNTVNTLKQAYPNTFSTGNIGGLLTPYGELSLIGKGVGTLIKVAPEARAIAKIGSAAAKSAVEMGVLSSGDEVSKAIMNDPSSAQQALVNIGLSTALGGLGGAFFGSAGELWKAKVGPQVSRSLDAISKRVGGIDGVVSDAVQDTINKSGIELAPEVKAGLSDDPMMQKAFQTLQQSDTTSAGQELQDSVKRFKNDAGAGLIDALGSTPEKAAAANDINMYDRGKQIANTLADEYSSQINPIAQKFETLKDSYKNTPLLQDTKLTLPNGEIEVRPGVATQINDRIAELAQKEGWAYSPEIMKEVDNVAKFAPQLKSLDDLSKLQTAIGNNTASTLPFGQQTPLSRAGAMIKGILRDIESETAERKLGEASPELVDEYKAARAAYSEQAKIKEALDDRLRVRGSVSGYAKGLKAMAQTDAESVFNKLSGKNDNDLINLMQTKFPKTAELIKQLHADKILESGVNKAKEGYNINGAEVLRKFNAMDPNLRNFVFNDAKQNRINSIGSLMSKIDGIPNYNFSNTARTIDKLGEHIPGTAVGLTAALLGHGPVASLLLGHFTKVLSKDAPDAIRFALLKFAGAGKQISAPGFAAAVEHVQNVIKGAAKIESGVKKLFQAGSLTSAAYVSSQTPSDNERKRLDKQINEIAENPNKILAIAQNNDLNHYMPEHTNVMNQTAIGAATYLKSLQPATSKQNPLDKTPPVNKEKQIRYENALNIALNPNLVLDKIKSGSVTVNDIQDLHSMYPALYQQYSNKILEYLGNSKYPVPYKTRIGLSQFLAQPIDSTFTPQGIMGAQPGTMQGANSPQQAQEAHNGKSLKTLGKSSKMYQTPGQSREAVRAGQQKD